MIQLQQEKVLLEELLSAQKRRIKKLVSVLATSAPINDTSRKATLEWVPCIQYLVWFHRNKDKDEDRDVRALIDLSSEVNAMHPTYATKLGLRTRIIDVGVQKIDRSHLDTFEMVIANFSVKDKLGRVWFF